MLQSSVFPEERSLDDAEGDYWDKLFGAHLKDAYLTLGSADSGHAGLDIRSPIEFEDDFEQSYSSYRHESFNKNGRLNFKKLDQFPWYVDGGMGPNPKSLALVRISAARDAINAKNLAKVVNALRDRNIKTRYATIKDGEPRKFLWDQAARRFSSKSKSTSSGPSFTLLGPSLGLVKRHWKKLPIGTYAFASYLKSLPIEKITPSNELSYIGVFESHNQRILISGDAGYVDFMPSQNQPFYPKLIEQFNDLDIVQVAHHAGHNAYFYNCLLDSEFVRRSKLLYLLLSHRTNDSVRPSAIFSRFIDELERDASSVQLLFTSTPKEAKVRDYKHLIAPTAGLNQTKRDVGLSFDGKNWNVQSHHVEVPRGSV